jgi:outer membrane protein
MGGARAWSRAFTQSYKFQLIVYRPRYYVPTIIARMMRPLLIEAPHKIRPDIRAALLFLVLCVSGAASAQETERSWDLALAVGYGERTNPLVGGDSIDINTVIDFSWYGERFFFDNGDLGFLLQEHRNYSFNLVATINNERNFYNYLTGSNFGLQSLTEISKGFGAAGSTITGEQTPGKDFAGTADSERDFLTSIGAPQGADTGYVNLNTELPDRDSAVNSGIEFLHIGPWGDIQAQLLSDVSGTHHGQEAWLSWSHPWYTPNNEFTLTLGAEWKSGKLISYYYGVRPEESFPGREAYEAGAGTSTFVRFAARHAFSPHWHGVAMVEREFLSSAIRNSPIVDDDVVDTFFAGLLYQF